MTAKLIFLAGSARKASINKALAQEAAEMAEGIGAQATFIDLADYDMPIFNEDWEAEHGRPEAAGKLRDLFAAHDGFLLASPEYNSSIAPLIKNTFDWMTRTQSKEEDGLIAFRGKVAGLIAASPGGLGGIRVLVPTRMWLGNIGVHVIPNQLAVPGGMDDAQKQKLLKDVVQQLVDTAKAL